MRHWGRITATLAATALIVGLAGCAPEPVAGWQPAAARAVPGVVLAVAPIDQAGTGEQVAKPTLDQTGLGVVGGRLRNDPLALAARFVYVPGVPAFNTKVNELVWAAIHATGAAYTPQVYPVDAGLGDRGCVAGSTTWAAADVLARAETGPTGGTGTAVTCEVTAAFGNTLAFSFRVVVGGPTGVVSDTSTALEVDVASGQVVAGMDRWSTDAPAALWKLAVEALRAGAGGLSSAPPAAPDDAQLVVARAALASATALPDGGVRVTLPTGLAAPELAELGVPATTEPTVIDVQADTALGLSSEAWKAQQAERGTPFAGISAAATSVAIDCALIPCVALTYDDGPSAYTPQLLDTLQQEHALATFFLVGRYVPGATDTVRRIYAEGHALGSHTMSHADLTTLGAAAVRAEVQGAANAIQQVTGAPVTIFRPPYGAVNNAVLAAAGMPAILWSVDTNDWRDPGQQALFDRSVPVVAPGGIILFHDTHPDSVAAAGTIIQGLRARGFEPVTVPQLFGGAIPAGRVSAR